MGLLKKFGRHGNDVIRMPRVPSFTSMHGLKARTKKTGWCNSQPVLVGHRKQTQDNSAVSLDITSIPFFWNTVSVPSMALAVANEQITREGCV